ncbi:10390_t:CDS:2 [Entrophospora sp. SA101]|nr:12194_t:CDS:2 [Entrophospora sp. SA101]CAJ0748989.1 10390_t:CDS:2 [Entrophospora sp. SA101]CAJ0837265.1 3335_t:CDS:2 [Entrophospora sp. SA101]CAJ0841911.1 10675_t:CDS:2 [Entrophospora sp. SA101]
MTIIARLNAKKLELENRLTGQSNWGSQGKEILQYKIEKLNELITAYGSTTLPVSLTNARQILDQQVGFEEQKKKGLGKSGVGPAGIGKSSFAQILAQALGKSFFNVSLGGLSEPSVLIGSEASSPANNMGQLARALVESKTPNPLILLDEIDKTGSSFKTAIHNCLLNILDPVQNQEILDYYLEQKKEIAQKIIEKWFAENGTLNRNNFEITPAALETIINKTQEKGVRQLKMALNSIFDYCLLQWAREARSAGTESKINIDSDLVNEIIPHDFPNIDQGDDPDQENDKEQLKNLRKELKALGGEKDKQLKAIKLYGLYILRQNKERFDAVEQKKYEERIRAATSWEEIEIIKQISKLKEGRDSETQKRNKKEKNLPEPKKFN